MSDMPTTEETREQGSEATTSGARGGVEMLTPLFAVLARQIATEYTGVEDGHARLIHTGYTLLLALALGVLTYLLRS